MKLLIATVLTACLAMACSGPDSNVAAPSSSVPSASNAILFVERDRAEVVDSDDYDGEILIERADSDAIACVHVVRTKPSGPTYTLPSLLAFQPDEVGDDYFVSDGVRVESGDFVFGDLELGSAERPPNLAGQYTQAKEALLVACEPLDLDRRFGEVFESVPIIFIENVRDR